MGRDNLAETFQYRLAELCEQKQEERATDGLVATQKAIAEEIGIKGSDLTKYLNGGNLPNANTLVKIARYFDVTTDYLLGLTESPYTAPEKRRFQELTGLSTQATEVLLRVSKDPYFYTKLVERKKRQGQQPTPDECLEAASERSRAQQIILEEYAEELLRSGTIEDIEEVYRRKAGAELAERLAKWKSVFVQGYVVDRGLLSRLITSEHFLDFMSALMRCTNAGEDYIPEGAVLADIPTRDKARMEVQWYAGQIAEEFLTEEGGLNGK